MRPLFRWVVGDVSAEGFYVLSQAIRNIIRIYKNYFDFLICSNAVHENSKKNIKKIAEKFDIKIYEQSWLDLPIDQSLISKAPNVDRQGTFWKICPPRMRLKSHEIICDNDIILVNPINSIFEFLEKNVILMMKEDAFCVGKYFPLFKEKENYNSGLYGFPPNYNFEEDLKTTWIKNGRYHGLLWRDEQGLVTSTLKKHDHITIESDEIIHLFDSGRCSSYDFKIIEEEKIKTRVMENMKFNEFNFSKMDKGYHFLGVNRSRHRKWIEYKRHGIFL